MRSHLVASCHHRTPHRLHLRRAINKTRQGKRPDQYGLPTLHNWSIVMVKYWSAMGNKIHWGWIRLNILERCYLSGNLWLEWSRTMERVLMFVLAWDSTLIRWPVKCFDTEVPTTSPKLFSHFIQAWYFTEAPKAIASMPLVIALVPLKCSRRIL